MRIQRWANSLGLRISSALAPEALIEHNTEVELALRESKLMVAPVGELSLDALLAGVTEENVHGEFETASAAGSEAW